MSMAHPCASPDCTEYDGRCRPGSLRCVVLWLIGTAALCLIPACGASWRPPPIPQGGPATLMVYDLADFLPRIRAYRITYHRSGNGVSTGPVVRRFSPSEVVEGLMWSSADGDAAAAAESPGRPSESTSPEAASEIARAARMVRLRFDPALPLWPESLPALVPQTVAARVEVLSPDGSVWQTGRVRRTCTAEGLETISTAAGTFEDCLRLQCTTTMTVGLIGTRVIEYYWLHPDVGIARHIQRIELRLWFIPLQRTVTYSLASFAAEGPASRSDAGVPLAGRLRSLRLALSRRLLLDVLGFRACFETPREGSSGTSLRTENDIPRSGSLGGAHSPAARG